MGVATAKIRPTLALWGARFGFMSYGWDAGVLGGVLETTSFQSAMKIMIIITIRNSKFMEKNALTGLVPEYHDPRDDRGLVPARLVAGLLHRRDAVE